MSCSCRQGKRRRRKKESVSPIDWEYEGKERESLCKKDRDNLILILVSSHFLSSFNVCHMVM